MKAILYEEHENTDIMILKVVHIDVAFVIMSLCNVEVIKSTEQRKQYSGSPNFDKKMWLWTTWNTTQSVQAISST